MVEYFIILNTSIGFTGSYSSFQFLYFRDYLLGMKRFSILNFQFSIVIAYFVTFFQEIISGYLL